MSFRLLREQLRGAAELYRQALATAEPVGAEPVHPKRELESSAFAELAEELA